MQVSQINWLAQDKHSMSEKKKMIIYVFIETKTSLSIENIMWCWFFYKSFYLFKELDQCIGCFQVKPNLKLQKLCEEVPDQPNCTSCYCRPMWCVDCMGRWFASRQDQEHQNKWLSSKCTCPMCRATFCMLDICPLTTIAAEWSRII